MSDTLSLSPCPFCGSTDLQVVETDYCGDYYSPSITVECRQCPASMYVCIEKPGSVKTYITEASAIKREIIEKWNTRLTPTPTPET